MATEIEKQHGTEWLHQYLEDCLRVETSMSRGLSSLARNIQDELSDFIVNQMPMRAGANSSGPSPFASRVIFSPQVARREIRLG